MIRICHVIINLSGWWCKNCDKSFCLYLLVSCWANFVFVMVKQRFLL